MRQRWMKCVVGGSPTSRPESLSRLDISKLLLLDSADPLQCPVSEEDVDIFYNNVDVDEIGVVFQDTQDVSHFVTLAMEAATMLDSTNAPSDTVVSQRRFTAASSGRLFEDGCISAGVTELIFPSTAMGTVSTQKIPLQNWSSQNQEVCRADAKMRSI